jgi:S-DNA-T family DNA segregation ATPase FtsK/SpoIIIE
VPAGEGFRLPPLELLQQPQEAEAAVSAEELKADSAILQRKLSDFGLHGKVLRVHSGPVVAMHEFEPAAGVKLQRVVSLAEDLSLALRAPSVRIAPLPGKSTIGIEVPHRMRRTVALRQVLSSEAFRKSTSKLTLALGVDIYGRAVVAELEQMPHLLVAGSTGTGKSVALNTMILSILYKALPQEVKLLLIDPKLLELSAYEAIPHLISPVITSPRAASEALKKMVSEMQRRYRLIAEQGARSIEGYNLAVQPQERLSYIVVFIDELADLMLTAQAEVEDSIVRLAQMARACGIHLVVATQRPSVDVITGIIKANFPARVAFQVSSRVDSRTILDAPGAEQLIGRGDMLLSMPGQKLQRVHGAYVSEAEVRAVADYLRAQGPPDYGLLEALQVPQQGQEASQGQDDLYEQALEVAAQAGEVSISMLQRRLKVGFNRAARLMELMEQEGLVGPPRGAGKPRAFLGRKK